MQFVYPSFLFALSAVAIPIIIHLFHFRRYKKIIFSDIRFLKQVQEETKSRQKLKELLILLSRILAIAFLVFAFAQPFIPFKETSNLASQKAVSIFIDNSFSMGNEGKDGVLLETAKTKARSIVKAYGNDEQFQIITNDFEGKQQRLVSKADALKNIDEVQMSAASKSLSKIISRQKQAFENVAQLKQVSYIISDFQKNSTDIFNLKNDSNLLLNFIPVQSNITHNLFIDSCWLESPIVRLNIPIKLKVRIRNSSNEDAENITVALKLNEAQKALVTINCTAQSLVDTELSFTLTADGWQQAELSILDHPITFDDKLFFVIKPSSSSNILCINGGEENKFINKIFEGDNAYLLKNSTQNQIDYLLFNKQQFIILNEPQTLSTGLSEELKKYISNGGLLLIIPPAQSSNKELNTFLTELNAIGYGVAVKQNLKADHINIQEETFADVFQKVPKNIDLPTIFQYYETIKNTNSRGVSLMQLNNGLPFIYQSTYKKGKLILLTTPLNTDWSNLPQHAIFVPFMLKLALENTFQSRLYYTIDKDKWISTTLDWQGAEKIAHIFGNGIDMLCDVKQQDANSEVNIDNQLKKAGIYQLQKKENKIDELFFAMNYKRDESYMQTLDEKELTKNIKASIMSEDATVLQQKISQELTGKQLWRVCVLLCLLFVLIEILLLKLL